MTLTTNQPDNQTQKTYTICILPGDGIGPEVIEESVRLLKALPVSWNFVYADIGYDAYQRLGSALPQATLDKVQNADASLFGAVTTPPNIPNYSSPILCLRKHFDLYANIRPCRSMPTDLSRPNINMITVRENTEGLYSKSERVEEGGDRAITERIITRKGSERIVRHAFELARKKGFKKVTVVHKANVLRETCGLFIRVADEVAQQFPDIEKEECIVDACAMQLIKRPESFEVLVTTNMFGDILSDEASMLVGGLGLAYSGNIGDNIAVFESVHGSAPKYVGTHNANPMATFLAAKLMLDYLGLDKEAQQLEQAVHTAIAHKQTTQDLGGTLTTQEVTDAVIHHLQQLTVAQPTQPKQNTHSTKSTQTQHMEAQQ